MEKEIKEMMYGFLADEFAPIKRRNELKRWKRVVKVEQGYLRPHTKYYSWKKGLDLHLISIDLMTILHRVFGTPPEVNGEIVSRFFENYKI